MVREQIVQYIDDLTGGPATEHRYFVWASGRYRLDLNEENAKEVDAFMDRLAASAQHDDDSPGGGGQRAASVRKPPRVQAVASAAREQRARIRDWLKRNGYGPKDRGSIAEHLLEIYYQNHPGEVRIK